jgi:hypothetical protein
MPATTLGAYAQDVPLYDGLENGIIAGVGMALLFGIIFPWTAGYDNPEPSPPPGA